MHLELDYFEAVEVLAQSVPDDEAPHLYLERLKADGAISCAATANAAAALRLELLNEDDWRKFSGCLEFGFFRDPEPLVRVAWWILSLDVANAVRRLSLRLECQKYERGQRLFVADPHLFESIRRSKENDRPDFELIDERALVFGDMGGAFKINAGYAKLSPSLNSRIVTWARETFPEAPRFVRLNPHVHYLNEPQMLLTEAAIVPADPSWLSDLSLYGPDYAQYELLAGDRDDAYQYGIGLRRLEVSALRRHASAELSMMIEELPASDDPSGVMVGHCIHLDTKAPPGTPPEAAGLMHLDLAINCYEGDTRAARMKNTLQSGKSEDASYRVHLYRIENVPLTAVFDFASMFIRSSRLVEQWLTDLHRYTEKNETV